MVMLSPGDLTGHSQYASFVLLLNFDNVWFQWAQPISQVEIQPAKISQTILPHLYNPTGVALSILFTPISHWPIWKRKSSRAKKELAPLPNDHNICFQILEQGILKMLDIATALTSTNACLQNFQHKRNSKYNTATMFNVDILWMIEEGSLVTHWQDTREKPPLSPLTSEVLP